MGWSSGSDLMACIIQDLKKKLPDEDARTIVYKVLIKHFENYDCDTLYECELSDPAFKAALKRRR